MQPLRKPPPWDPESAVAFWVNQASRSILRRHESRLRPMGFGMGQLPVLVALSQGEALSQKNLATRARVEQPTMTEMVARMERDGIVQRAPNPEDRRGSLISLTRKARARLPDAMEALIRGEGEATRGFTKTEKATLIALLQRVVANVEDQGAQGDSGRSKRAVNRGTE